jgi:hypothetical protein
MEILLKAFDLQNDTVHRQSNSKECMWIGVSIRPSVCSSLVRFAIIHPSLHPRVLLIGFLL